jgi:hypothetical protein
LRFTTAFSTAPPGIETKLADVELVAAQDGSNGTAARVCG